MVVVVVVVVVFTFNRFRFSFLFIFLFFSLHPGMFIFVSLRLCSSHLLLSASTYFILHVISARVICTLPHLGILLVFIRLVFFFVAFFCRVAFVFCCALLPATLARDLPTLIISRLFFLFLTV